jgi:hypothetical protein
VVAASVLGALAVGLLALVGSGADSIGLAVLGGALVLVLVALAGTLLLAGVWWALAGPSPTPGALVALGGAAVLPLSLSALVLGVGAGAVTGLVLAGVWVAAGIAAGSVPAAAGGVRPRARPPRLDEQPWWTLVRVASVLALVVLLVAVGRWAAEAFSLFPTKEREEGLERIRLAAAWQWRTMLLGAVPIVAVWWLLLRRQAAALVLAVAAGIGSLWSIVGFAASLPVFLTAVVLLVLPARPVQAARTAVPGQPR